MDTRLEISAEKAVANNHKESSRGAQRSQNGRKAPFRGQKVTWDSWAPTQNQRTNISQGRAQKHVFEDAVCSETWITLKTWSSMTKFGKNISCHTTVLPGQIILVLSTGRFSLVVVTAEPAAESVWKWPRLAWPSGDWDEDLAVDKISRLKMANETSIKLNKPL